MKINILITGHSGYIGSALYKQLLHTGFVDRVIGYDIEEGDDILNFDRLVNVMKSNRINLVIHLAAVSTVSACNHNPKLAFKTNAFGTKNILDAMTQVGCKNIIYASTSSVYDSEHKIIYRESMTPRPYSSYGSSKMLGEHAIYSHFHLKENKGNYIILRMFNVVGISGYHDVDDNSKLKNDRLFTALHTGNVTIYGKDYQTHDGTCERDYVSLKDTIDAYIRSIKMIMYKNIQIKSNAPNNIKEIINICTGIPISVKCIINSWNHIIVERNDDSHNKSDRVVKYKYGDRREGDRAVVYGSNNKAFKLLGWIPKMDIEDIIMDYV